MEAFLNSAAALEWRYDTSTSWFEQALFDRAGTILWNPDILCDAISRGDVLSAPASNYHLVPLTVVTAAR